MSSVRLSTAIIFCLCIAWTRALPKRPALNGESSGAGEIPNELLPEYRPFDRPLGKGYPDEEVFKDYDLDSEGGPGKFPEYDVNDIHPQRGGEERPFEPGGRIPEEKHPEDLPKEKEEDHHSEKPTGGEETHDNEEGEEEPKESEEEPKGSEEEPKENEGEPKGGEEEPKEGEGEPEEEDTHAVEDEEKPRGSEEEETEEGEEKVPLPFNTALFSFQQVNHYIKQLEKAMEHVFSDTLESASLLNNTFANTTEEEVEVDGHKYKVEKSLIKTKDEDRNSTLLIEAISSVSEDEPKKNRSERSNPDSEPIQ